MHCKVCDFGLSRAVQSNTSHTMTRNVGTLYYLCPEMLTDQSTSNSMDKANRATKVDVYSFGIIMWELFFECIPFTENEKTCKSFSQNQKTTNPISVLGAVVNGKRPSIPFDNEDELVDWMQLYLQEISKDKCHIVLQYVSWMKQCWDGEAINRPDFQSTSKEICSWLHQLK